MVYEIFLFSLYESMTTSDQFRPRHMLAGFIQLYTILLTSCLTVINAMLLNIVRLFMKEMVKINLVS